MNILLLCQIFFLVVEALRPMIIQHRARLQRLRPEISLLAVTNTAKTDPPSYKMYVPKNSREMAKFKNKVPFSEDIFEKIKYSVSLLTERMKKEKPLDIAAIDKLDTYIDEIIDDAHKYGPPERPTN
jgi:hypothetical protein